MLISDWSSDVCSSDLVPEEQRADDRDNDEFFEQFMGEILHCTVDELRTVIGGNDLHSWREARLECIELVLDRCDRFAGIFARAKNDDTARPFAFAVEFGNAESHFRADQIGRGSGWESVCQ